MKSIAVAILVWAGVYGLTQSTSILVAAHSAEHLTAVNAALNGQSDSKETFGYPFWIQAAPWVSLVIILVGLSHWKSTLKSER